jgi:hypothetical protein
LYNELLNHAILERASMPADSPDSRSSNWNQVNETVTMLDLAVTQLGWTLRDGDKSVDTLTSSFAEMVSAIEEIVNVANKMPSCDSQELILTQCNSIHSRVSDAIYAFQFYDALSQRLNHAADSLSEMRHLVNDPARLNEPGAWRQLQQRIRQRYPTDADKIMFDAVLEGASLEEAIALYQTKIEQESPAPEISFF